MDAGDIYFVDDLILEGHELNDDSIKIEKFSNSISIEGLPIADANNPKLPILYFDEILRRSDILLLISF